MNYIAVYKSVLHVYSGRRYLEVLDLVIFKDIYIRVYIHTYIRIYTYTYEYTYTDTYRYANTYTDT